MMKADALARRRRKPPRPARPGPAGPLAAGLRVARQAVVRERVPGRGVGRVLAVARADRRVAVEGSEPDAPRLPVLRMAAPEVRAARGAEALRDPARRLERAQQLLAREQPQRARRDPRLRGGGGPGAARAAGAVAPAGGDERLVDLEADSAAEAAAGERELRHAPRYRASSSICFFAASTRPGVDASCEYVGHEYFVSVFSSQPRLQ